MPFANLNTRRRLGIANASLPNASRWAKQVLRLPVPTNGFYDFPHYQGQIVHRAGSWEQGPSSAAAETCASAQADEEHSYGNVIREISVHDTVFVRRNTSFGNVPNAQFALDAHSGARYGQTYYLTNEPDFYSTPVNPQNSCKGPGIGYTTNACCPFSCWDPRDDLVDTTIFPNSALASFWQTRQVGPTLPQCNQAQTITSSMRAAPDALAFVYLRLKSTYEGQKDAYGFSKGHTVLLPSPSNPWLGDDEPAPTSATPGFWGTFFNKILKTGMSYGSNTETKIADIQELKALHLHYYSPPRGAPEVANMPLETVAEGASNIKRGVNWFRTYYGSGNSLPLDILLSESGPMWQLASQAQSKHKWQWSGGWNNFQSALSWWNTWLCWLIRMAPIASECNLTGSPAGTHTDSQALYANIHSPDIVPYVTKDLYEAKTVDNVGNPLTFFWKVTTNARNQWFFNSDTWAGGVVYSAEVIDVIEMVQSGRFQKSFSTFNSTPWDNSTSWRIGPFGACYKVWAEIGADAITENLNTGWVTNFNAGQIAETTVSLPAGYSTVFFPIIKGPIGSTYTTGTQVSFTWKNGAQLCNFGYCDTGEFPDSKNVNQIWDVPIYSGNGQIVGVSPRTISPAQAVYSAMVYPVVCYSSVARSVTVRLSRNYSGPRLAFGRPVVLPQACSWFTTQ